MAKKKLEVEYEDVEGEGKETDIDNVGETIPVSVRLTPKELDMVHKIRDGYGYDNVSDFIRDGIEKQFEALKNVTPMEKLIKDCTDEGFFGLGIIGGFDEKKLVAMIKDRKVNVLSAEDRKKLIAKIPEKTDDLFEDRRPLNDFCSLLGVTVEDFKKDIKEGKPLKIKL